MQNLGTIRGSYHLDFIQPSKDMLVQRGVESRPDQASQLGVGCLARSWHVFNKC